MQSGTITNWSDDKKTGQLMSSSGVVYEFPGYACRGFVPKAGFRVFIQAEVVSPQGIPRAVTLGRSTKDYGDQLVEKVGRRRQKVLAKQQREAQQTARRNAAFDRSFDRIEAKAVKFKTLSWKQRCALGKVKIPTNIAKVLHLLGSLGWSMTASGPADVSLVHLASRGESQLCIIVWPPMAAHGCELVLVERDVIIGWCGSSTAFLSTIEQKWGKTLEILNTAVDEDDSDTVQRLEAEVGAKNLARLFSKRVPTEWRSFVSDATPERKWAHALAGRSAKRVQTLLMTEYKRLGWQGHIAALQEKLFLQRSSEELRKIR